MFGAQFEREIREQPSVWRRIGASDAAARLADSFAHEVVLVGSGSSLFAAQLGAKALRRRGITAHALAATEAFNDNAAYRNRCVIAISQSGRSSDVLAAIDHLAPSQLVAITNSAGSPLAQRANAVIDIIAGSERAVPATKSVTATMLVLLRAASIAGGDTESRAAHTIDAAANAVETWLADAEQLAHLVEAARAIAKHEHLVFLGTDYGAPVAREAALKFKEATYVHAEGFEAGEFRHGAAAMIDARSAVCGFVDEDGVALVGRAFNDVNGRGAQFLTFGPARIDAIAGYGPSVDRAWTVLSWMVAMQMCALHVARARSIDSDTPRGLVKSLTS